MCVCVCVCVCVGTVSLTEEYFVIPNALIINVKNFSPKIRIYISNLREFLSEEQLV